MTITKQLDNGDFIKRKDLFFEKLKNMADQNLEFIAENNIDIEKSIMIYKGSLKITDEIVENNFGTEIKTIFNDCFYGNIQ